MTGIQRQRYLPYGQRRGTATGAPGANDNITTTERGFIGQTEDATGLDYLNNRYYDPVTARFISVDPLVAVTRDAYGYGNNNPIRYSDPGGLEAGSWISGGAEFWAWQQTKDMSLSDLMSAYGDDLRMRNLIGEGNGEEGSKAHELSKALASRTGHNLGMSSWASTLGVIWGAKLGVSGAIETVRNVLSRFDRPSSPVPDPEPVYKPDGTPNRDSPWHVSYRDAEGNLQTVGNANGVHAEVRIQQASPGAQMSRPFGWRTVDGSTGPQWVSGTVCTACQMYPPSLFPPGTGGAPGGPWESGV